MPHQCKLPTEFPNSSYIGSQGKMRKSLIILLSILCLPFAFFLWAIRNTLFALSDVLEFIAERVYLIDRRLGKFFKSLEKKVIKNQKKMTTKKQLQDRVTDLESQLLKAKQGLANFRDFPKIDEAKVGDELEDGSIVVYNYSGVAIVIAPKATERRSKWSHNMPLDLRNSLECKGFQPNQWFLPDVKQLNYAMMTVPDQFEKTPYWSSDILKSDPTKWVEHRVGYPLAVNFPRDGKAGPGYTIYMDMVLYMRAFRCILY